MLILALDSTAITASVAVCRDDVALATFHVDNGNTHSETLLPMVEAALAVSGLSVDDIDLFACSNGPGSFTGVRIGVATVKGLTFGKNKTVLGVSTLEALATNALPAAEGTLLVPVMNARRGQLYNALFTVKNGALCRLIPDRAIAATDLAAEFSKESAPYLLMGDGLPVITPCLNGSSTPDLLIRQNAVSVARVALQRYLAGERGTDAALAPVYLRLPQAERERLARLSTQS